MGPRRADIVGQELHRLELTRASGLVDDDLQLRELRFDLDTRDEMEPGREDRGLEDRVACAVESE